MSGTQHSRTRTRVSNLLRRAEHDATALQEVEHFRRSFVVMFTDIQGSTAYFEKHGDAAGLFMVHVCNDTIRRAVEKHGGRVIKTIGDGTMATFEEPKKALEAAIEIQTALTESESPRRRSDRIALRVGLHYGAAIVRTNDVIGDAVNVAARIESVAGAGQIVISEEMYLRVRGCGFALLELGRYTLKGKSAERTLFQVKWR
jgi:adenylate cyclase